VRERATARFSSYRPSRGRHDPVRDLFDVVVYATLRAGDGLQQRTTATPLEVTWAPPTRSSLADEQVVSSRASRVKKLTSLPASGTSPTAVDETARTA
jgi:hypothetical protein